MDKMLEVKDLYVKFLGDRTIHALNRVSFDLRAGEVLGLLGESGSGKSVLLRAVMRLLPEARTSISGSIVVMGAETIERSKKEIREICGQVIAMIFQEPGLAFDPVYTIGDQIAETVMYHSGCSRKEAMDRALEVFDMVRIPAAKKRIKAYPFELSGGMRQRAMIAMALACRPKILLADEPTTALDTTVQIQILLLLRELQRELGMSMIFVTHDIGVTAEICDRVLVMYGGQIVENGSIDQIIKEPCHPYLAGLLDSSVRGSAGGGTLSTIPGSPPVMDRPPQGCPFVPRCSFVVPECSAEPLATKEVHSSHYVKCVHYQHTNRPQALKSMLLRHHKPRPTLERCCEPR